ncbi:hypothetical protein NL676_033593 [Syzygium grande]|nr:hypothetical protein NL676_033593 [Syzygium grande]
METSRGVLGKNETDEVIVMISGSEYLSRGSSPRPNIELTELENLQSREQNSNLTGPSAQGLTQSSPSPNKPPRIPTKTPLLRSSFSKPKSRLTEPSYPGDADLVEGKTQVKSSQSPYRNSPRAGSPYNAASSGANKDNVKSVPITPRTPLIASPAPEEEDDEEVYKTANLKVQQMSGKKFPKLLSSSFQCTRFFDRIQESLFHQYIVRTLSGPPLMEMAEMVGRSRSSGQLSFMKYNKDGAKKQEEVIDVEKLHKIKQDKVSAWTMKGLINVISMSGLSTLAESLEQSDDEEAKQQDREITNEWEARAAAYQIFRNVAKPGSKFIEEEDLLRFMKKEDVDNVIPLFPEAVETRKIRRSSLKNWLVNVYLERKSLALSLNDTKTAIDELNNLASAVLIIVIIIIWLLLMGFMTTKVLVFISSQLLLVVFMFGNTAKTVFEAIIFVFVMHPFDVGDRCVIDGVQMVVEEMNILTTIFLRYDGEKIFYPNSVLATKPISNFYRSPEMSDVVEFTVDFSTSVEKIGDLKSRIKTYLESKPKHWRPGHNVVVKEIENVNKLKLGLYITHTINFQNYGDKNSRRSELMLELKKIFEELDIKYRLLPQEVQISYIGSAATNGQL